MKFECPHCRQHLDADLSMVGQEIACPRCRRPIVVVPPVTLGRSTALSDTLGQEPMKHGNSVVNAQAAELQLEMWQRETPPVCRAGPPRGRAPSAAIFLAVLCAMPTAFTVMMLMLFASGAVLDGVAYIVNSFVVTKTAWPAQTAVRLALVIELMTALSMVVPLACVMGNALNRVTAWFTRVCKCPNVRLVQVTCTGAVVLAFACRVFEAPGHWPFEAISRGSLAIGEVFLGLLFATVMIFVWVSPPDAFSGEGVPLCGRCRIFMTSRKLPPLSFRAARHAVGALKTHDLQAFMERLKGEAGNRATPRVYTCPRCHDGLVEVMVHFAAQWSDRTARGQRVKASKAVTWCAACVAVTPDDLRAIATKRKRTRGRA